LTLYVLAEIAETKVGIESGALTKYGQSIVSYVSDYGTEAKFLEVS